ncbi:cap-specific mrna nucleoside-2-o-methyltransferase 1-like protein [Lasius niger]|uniref:Cap-specific mrna nucleoside-2-o-methyltransferase 1-like protein n=1 Tax=Lasius niger TaxID=67767 RepID=A0A0J7KQ72_LASNI|nr:cap-specific mrna nucleoside-2-o-methyltransferase 1-like protein [Lasius niger]
MSGWSFCFENDIDKKYSNSLKYNEMNNKNHDENICKYKNTKENKPNIGDTINNTEKKYIQEIEIAGNTCIDENKNNILHASKIQNMMKKMGYKPGKGLGKNDQGRVEPVETVIQHGRRGFGHYIHKAKRKKSNSGDITDNIEEENYTRESETANNAHIDENKNNVLHASKIQNMMKKMGYKPGKGLGKNDQGRVEPVETIIQRGRRGFGHYIHKTKRKKLNNGDAIENMNEEECTQEIQKANNIHIDEDKNNEVHTLKIQNMMKKMGYKPGKGLGKNDQGRVEPVEAITQQGRRGFGFIAYQASKKKVAILKKVPVAPSSFPPPPPPPSCKD